MPEPAESEFTGERVIPGLVDQDLLNEHLARYRFAARFADGARVLDAGCGAGYGSAVLADAAAQVTAADISADAIRHAREHFSRDGVRFLQGSCEALPFADGAFDLVTAFEVIEHLERWPQLLSEAFRVLNPRGVLLVSTPNKSYYAESRATAGPNPFHCHEFDLAEFREALREVFPHVQIRTQNHAAAIVFAPMDPATALLDASGDTSPASAHFYVAICSREPIDSNEVYAWLPSTSNLLRERERHIARLEGELAKKDAWLNELVTNHAALQQSHEATLVELKQRNEWADGLNHEIAERRAAIAKLQQEAAANLQWVRALELQILSGDAEILRLGGVSAELEAEVAARSGWARHLEQQLAERTLHVQIQADQIASYEAHVEMLNESLRSRRAELKLIRESKWIRLGRKLGLGPVVSVAGEE